MVLENELLPLQWSVVILVAVIAACFDVRTRRVPNRLTGPVWLAGLIWASWSSGLSGFTAAIAGSVLLAVPYVLLFMFAGGGAGDAKLMGALGAWLGLTNGVITLVAVACAGVVLALAYALFKKRLRLVLAHMKGLAYALFYRHGKLSQADSLMPNKEEMLTIPYSVAVLSGVCLAAGVVLI